MATGVAVPSRQEAHDQASALTTHGELGWFYHVKTLGAVKAWPWGSLACQDFARSPVFSFAGGSHPPGYPGRPLPPGWYGPNGPPLWFLLFDATAW